MDTSQIFLLGAIVVVGASLLVLRSRRQAAARETYGQALADAVSDGELTPEERDVLRSLRKKGALTASDVRDAGVAVYRDALDVAGQDARLTPEEDAALHRLQEQLGLTDADLEEDHNQLARLRLLARIEGGSFPDIASPIQLIPDERCYWVVQCTLAERLAVRSSRTEPRGQRYDIGTDEPFSALEELSELRPSDDILPSDLGVLVITSRRTVFQGARQTVAVPHARVESVTLYADGLRVDEIKPPARRFFLTEDPELAAAILLQASRVRRRQIRRDAPGKRA